MSKPRCTSAAWAPRSAGTIGSALLVTWLLGGCVVVSQNIRMPPRLKGPQVTVRQYCGPTQKLPGEVRTLAVACFGGSGESDRPWAQATATATSKALAANLQAFPQQGLVYRGGPGGLLGSPPEGAASTATAADLGRRAGADAVVTGNVAVGTERGRPALAVHFALVRSSDGQVLDRWEYRGRHAAGGVAAPGRPGGGTIALHDLLSEAASEQPRRPLVAPSVPQQSLPRQAGEHYARRVSPHWRVLRLALADGGGAFGDAGRQAAAAGNSLEAVLNFRRAVRRDSRDPGAWYNLAVMYESRGEFKEARNAYREAVDIYDTVPFRRGLQRTERELRRQTATSVVKD